MVLRQLVKKMIYIALLGVTVDLPGRGESNIYNSKLRLPSGQLEKRVTVRGSKQA